MMNETRLRVALYARVSSDQQVKAATIESQLSALEDRIAQDNLEEFLTNPYGPQQRTKRRRKMTTRGGNVSTHRILQKQRTGKNVHR